ncbi:MAG TPA: hypothetical protein VK157_16595 [Phycisphaerales bacterium]|nr:hypothetical protein [Phycisphaerales bacterium]
MGVDSVVILSFSLMTIDSMERYLASLIAVVAPNCTPRVACYALPGDDVEIDLDARQSPREWAAVALAKALECPSIWKFHMSVLQGTEVTIDIEIRRASTASASPGGAGCHIHFNFHRQSPRLENTPLPDPSYEVLVAYKTLETEAADGLRCTGVTWGVDW